MNGIEATLRQRPGRSTRGDSTSCTSTGRKRPVTSSGCARICISSANHSRWFSIPTRQKPRLSSTCPASTSMTRSPTTSAVPLAVTTGEPIQVTCSYDPTLAQELPSLRTTPPHSSPGGMGRPMKCASGSRGLPPISRTHAASDRYLPAGPLRVGPERWRWR